MHSLAFRQFASLAGRILLALIFVLSGWGKIGSFAMTSGFMASKGLPMTDVLLVLTIVIELVGGLMIVVGWRARWAALAIFLFLIPTTFIFHNFWAVDPAEMRNQMNAFMKNIAIMGGMLYIMAYGPGPLSIDERDAAP